MNTNRKRFIAATLPAMLCALLSGCVGTIYRVGVSGFAEPAYTGGRSCWLLPGNKSITADDLEFREYAAYLRHGLSQSGFTEAQSLDQADLAIFVSYGIGDTKQRDYSYSFPIFGQTGGGTYNFSSTTFSGSGAATTYGTLYQQPQYGVVGSQQFSGTEVTHLRHLLVDAIDLKPYRTDKKTVSVWRTEVLSRGTSADLRHVFPVLVVAATPHFGKNTKERVVLDISENDKRLQQLRSRGEK